MAESDHDCGEDTCVCAEGVYESDPSSTDEWVAAVDDDDD